jgi:predicted HD phosphohydrolase
MALSLPELPDVVLLLPGRGAAMYGHESVTQLEHALQCAGFAEQAGTQNTPVAANLLHDLGHLLRMFGGYGPGLKRRGAV